MKLNEVPIKNGNIRTRKVQEGEVIVDYLSEKKYLLMDSIETVWILIDGKRSVKDIIEKIKEEFQGSDEMIEEYVMESLEFLVKNKLVDSN